MNENQQLVEFAQAFADPLRAAILQRLIEGPATASELVSITATRQSRVSNHLALLRERRLVRATRQGRQMVYELHDPSVGELMEAMVIAAGAVPVKLRASGPLTKARTCYDHLAGRLGVALFDALIAQKAILEPSGPRATVELGPAGIGEFKKLGIDPEPLYNERRKFAVACPDWTERRSHLGGALGAAVWTTFLERGWVARQPGTRAVVLTATGRRSLSRRLGIRFTKIDL